MFREMRLAAQQLSQEETIEILEKASNGTLAINGDGPYPYSVPISYAYHDGKIYFHGAMAGQKYDLLKADGHACLSVVTMDDVDPSIFTTRYRSAVVYGDVSIITDMAEIHKAMLPIIDKYCTGLREGGAKYIDASAGGFCVFCMDIKHMTGKRSEE